MEFWKQPNKPTRRKGWIAAGVGIVVSTSSLLVLHELFPGPPEVRYVGVSPMTDITPDHTAGSVRAEASFTKADEIPALTSALETELREKAHEVQLETHAPAPITGAQCELTTPSPAQTLDVGNFICKLTMAPERAQSI